MSLKEILILLVIAMTASITVIASELQYTTQKDDFRLQPLPRVKVVEKTLVFPRSQLKYGLFQNYLHWWIDRPLFFDRELRYPSGTFKHIMKDNFLRDVDIVKSYEVDGLANIANPPSHVKMYMESEGWLKETPVEKFNTLPEFAFEGSLTVASYQYYADVLKIALESKYSVRINGKVLVTSYVADNWSPAQIKELLTRLHNEFGNDFLFVPDLGINLYRQTQVYQGNKGNIPEKKDREFKDKLQEYLNVCDGLYFASYPRFREDDKKDYTVQFYSDFSEKYLVPVLLETMNKRENKGKLLGMSSAIGYINHLSGVNTGEYGTETLRKTFRAAVSVNPDFIILPEWNEVNENTCIQPTVANSLSSQRILKYFVRTLRRLPAVPNPGDDLSIPNLIVSYRETLKLGEAIRIEMLNVPDSSGNTTFKAQLNLNAADGKSIKQFPVETFNEGKMNVITYVIPSEQLAECQVLLPEIILTNQQGRVRKFKDLQYIRLHPTVCWNYKDVKQPLRDQLQPENVKFEIRKIGNEYAAAVDFKSPEKLASVEILDNEDEIYAYDRADEFKLSDNVVLQLHFIAGLSQVMTGSIFVRNASEFSFRPGEGANLEFLNSLTSPNGISINQKINVAKRNVFISIPKRDAEKAELEFDLNLGKFKVPVKTLMEYGVYGKSLPNMVYLLVERFDKAPDIPVRIKDNNVSFKCNLNTESRFPVYQLRAITESGKIFRSQPVIPEIATGKPMTLNVFSETGGKSVAVSVQRDRIPDLKYVFNPVCGDLIKSGYEKFWFGELGGGYKYGDPFHSSGGMPAETLNTAPRWIKSNDGWILDFDGIAEEITFPRETLPRGSFTMEFEAKVQSQENQILFRHYGQYIGSLTIMIKKGSLFASFTDMKIMDNSFDTGLNIPFDKWVRFKISYDLHTMRFNVDGQSKEFSFAGRALYIAPSAFGGHIRKGFGINEDMKFFRGQLKSLRITHVSE